MAPLGCSVDAITLRENEHVVNRSCERYLYIFAVFVRVELVAVILSTSHSLALQISFDVFGEWLY